MHQCIRFYSLRCALAGAFLLSSHTLLEAMSGEDLMGQCGANRSLIAGYVAGAFDKGTVDSDILARFYLDTFDARQVPERIEREKQAFIKSSLAVDGYCIPYETALEERAQVYCQYLSNSFRGSDKERR